VTDPKVMAAQIRAWANVMEKLSKYIVHDHAERTSLDLIRQMRDVAAREDKA